MHLWKASETINDKKIQEFYFRAEIFENVDKNTFEGHLSEQNEFCTHWFVLKDLYAATRKAL